MTRYRLLHESPTRQTHTLLREEPAESDVAAVLKMLYPHPERRLFRADITAPGRGHFVVLQRYDEADDRWTVVESIQQTRGGWSE